MRLKTVLETPEWASLMLFLAEETSQGRVFYPPSDQIFAAFEATPPEAVRVVILGQDPYPNAGQAHGFAFSVEPTVPLPRSLRNIFKELHSDRGIQPPMSGDLRPWAAQGVFLLNTVLTVPAGQANGHRKQGWEIFTDAVLKTLIDDPTPKAFVFWGKEAQAKATLFPEDTPHLALCAPHPSPLSARRGFFGSKPFSQINQFFEKKGLPAIDWQLPDPE